VVYDLNKGCTTNECVEKAKAYGVKFVPEILINVILVDCCKENGVDVNALKEAGLGQ
jgi:hypothetical protein